MPDGSMSRQTNQIKAADIASFINKRGSRFDNTLIGRLASMKGPIGRAALVSGLVMSIGEDAGSATRSQTFPSPHCGGYSVAVVALLATSFAGAGCRRATWP
jgi:hypothetical protein